MQMGNRLINREKEVLRIEQALGRSRVVALLGPRQCGKTTLARQFVQPDSANYFDLESPTSQARLAEPELALKDLRGLVVIDEIQRSPELFPLLRVLADRDPLPARFLILGSAAPELLRQSSESLAGRLEVIHIEGLRSTDLPTDLLSMHWLRGGFPRSLLAANDEDSIVWRRQFIQTFLERDMPQLGVRIAPQTLLRFWTMLSHYHGQIWNGAELARSLGISQPTVRHYLDLMSGVLMIRQLQPWHENLGKRQVKSPKIYIKDSGLLHALLGIPRQLDLETHPKLGASWEGYAIEEIIKALQPDECYFWATHSGAELDLLLIKEGRRLGIECKRMDAPKLTPSLKSSMQELRLDQAVVVYPGERRYALASGIEAIPLSELLRETKSGAFLLTKSEL